MMSTSTRASRAPIKYLNVEQMMQRIDQLRAARAASGRGSAPDETDACVWSIDEYSADRHTTALRQPAAATSVLPAQAAASDEDKYVWLGDDMAVQFEGIEACLADTPAEAADDPAQVPLDVLVAEQLKSSNLARVMAWSQRGYGAGLAALAVMVVLAVGAVSNFAPQNGANLLAMLPSKLSAGSNAWNEIPPDDAIASADDFSSDVRPAIHHRFRPERAEAAIRLALADQGFSDIGVSAGPTGDVFLAGAVYSLDEAHYVVRVVRRAVHSGDVYFLHPEVRQPNGPAYLGVTTDATSSESGAVVKTVVIGSPAYKAGFRPGDRITSLNDEPVADAPALYNKLAEYHPGDRIAVEISRNGAEQTIKVRLGEFTEVASR